MLTGLGSFSDVALASEAAQTHINAGADALTGTAQMVVGAIGVANEKAVPWFGTQSDQASLAPEVVVASQVYKWDVVLKQIIDLIKAGTLGGQSFEIDLANRAKSSPSTVATLCRMMSSWPPKLPSRALSTEPLRLYHNLIALRRPAWPPQGLPPDGMIVCQIPQANASKK